MVRVERDLEAKRIQSRLRATDEDAGGLRSVRGNEAARHSCRRKTEFYKGLVRYCDKRRGKKKSLWTQPKNYSVRLLIGAQFFCRYVRSHGAETRKFFFFSPCRTSRGAVARLQGNSFFGWRRFFRSQPAPKKVRHGCQRCATFEVATTPLRGNGTEEQSRRAALDASLSAILLEMRRGTRGATEIRGIMRE